MTEEIMQEDKKSYKIYEVNMHYLEEKIAKLNKKAVKLNCKPIIINILNTEFIESEDGTLDKVLEVSISGEPPIINGWMFIGTIEHREHGNIVKVIAGQNYPERYNKFDSVCEHCHVARQRKETYIVKNVETGEFKAVGKSCLKDFLGHNNPNGYASLMESLADTDWMEEFEGIPEGRGEYYISLEKYLAYVALEIRLHGWVSRSVARDYGRVASADNALSNMFPPKGYKRDKDEEYTENDIELAIKAIAWAKSLNEPDNNYLNNIHVLALEEMVSYKNVGFAASIVSSYTKHIEREIVKEQRETAKKQEMISDYVGTIGQKIETELTMLNVFGYETQWGYTNIYKFADTEGHIFIWKSSTYQEMEQGKVYKLKGTIKEHSEYNEVKQTVLTRCKVVA